MAKVLVTGADGFVGRALCKRLRQAGHVCVRAVRQGQGADVVAVGDIGSRTDWQAALAGCDTVIHLAARVHVMQETCADPLAAFREVNVRGSAVLAQAAARAGVRRFIYLSSIKVLGESTAPGQPFSAESPPCPQDTYGISKWEAEEVLAQIAAESGMELVIVRPPLVYGPGVKANFQALIRLVARGIPLPFGRIRNNRRSLVYLGNLVDLIACCVTHPGAPGHRFLVSDGDDLSTARLLEILARAQGCRLRLLPVPAFFLSLGARLLGRSGVAERLLGNLQVDMDLTCRQLEWFPPYTVADGMAATVSTLPGSS